MNSKIPIFCPCYTKGMTDRLDEFETELEEISESYAQMLGAFLTLQHAVEALADRVEKIDALLRAEQGVFNPPDILHRS
jgi:hypothetical protein